MMEKAPPMPAPQLEFYSSIVVLTGSGLSARSGLPIDLSLGQDGDWATLYPIHRLALQAQPNDCHLALAEWEKRVLERRGQFTLLTHNTDGLHQRAGSQNVVELAGSMHRLRCEKCEWNEDRFWELPLPECPNCGGGTRPDVAWFGESGPSQAEWLAQRALRRCDLFLALAVSESTPRVHDFAHLARFAKARNVLVSLEHTAHQAEEFDEVHDVSAEDFIEKIWKSAQAVKQPNRLMPLSPPDSPHAPQETADLKPLQKSFTSGYLAIYDIADFKTRNHLLGYAQGDQDLEEFAQVASAVGVQACMRYSQDQFVVISPRMESLEALQVTYAKEQEVRSGYRALACREGHLRSKIVTHNLRLRRGVRVAYVMVFRGQALDDAAKQVAERVKQAPVDHLLPLNEIQDAPYRPWSALSGEFSPLQCPFCDGTEFDWSSEDVALFGREGKCRQCGSDVEFENFTEST